ncbi:MAG: hypothetical protein C0432_00060 [Candidatus Puniceispirillum sp.]|nr:hypothetical protein [Candidatus Pelagibacter sp.]MBA4282677.1 hypothetical protein [Candidatus Puniceispirillum sp.]
MMVIIILTIFSSIAFLFPYLKDIFLYNTLLNSVIVCVILSGVTLCFWGIYRLNIDYMWFENLLSKKRPALLNSFNLFSLKPLAAIIEGDFLPHQFTPLQVKTLLSTIESRLEESRETQRYIMNLLIFLGLLGTFWGLSLTVGGISSVIGNVTMEGNDVKGAFEALKNGIHAPLAGMGTAFSCSMFGLAGSLIVGLLDLVLGKASSDFHQFVENKLSQFVRFTPFASGALEASEDNPSAGLSFSVNLLEQVVEGMSSLHNLMRQSEENRTSLTRTVQSFSEKLSQMSEFIIAHQNFSQKLAKNQVDMQEIIMALSKDGEQGRNDEIMKTHLRSIDATMNKLLEETIEGRRYSTDELKTEIRFLTRTLSSIAQNSE